MLNLLSPGTTLLPLLERDAAKYHANYGCSFFGWIWFHGKMWRKQTINLKNNFTFIQNPESIETKIVFPVYFPNSNVVFTRFNCIGRDGTWTTFIQTVLSSFSIYLRLKLNEFHQNIMSCVMFIAHIIQYARQSFD